MFTVIKKFGPFAAAHRLTRVPVGHQCGRIHGHNYEIEVELQSKELNRFGFVTDYGDLKVFEEYATARMDHRDLNEEFSFEVTAENLARHFFNWIKGTQVWPVVAVRVSESPGKTVSEYREDTPAPHPVISELTVNLNVEVRTEITTVNNILQIVRQTPERIDYFDSDDEDDDQGGLPPLPAPLNFLSGMDSPFPFLER